MQRRDFLNNNKNKFVYRMSGSETTSVPATTLATTATKSINWSLITNSIFIGGIAAFIMAQLFMSSHLTSLDDFNSIKSQLPSIVIPAIIGSFVLFIASYLYFQQTSSNVLLMNIILVFACLSVIMSSCAIGFLSFID
jgi:riboflavin transporter FmnP